VDYQTPNMGTVVHFMSGGVIPFSYDLEAYEDSKVYMTGGLVEDDLYANDRSYVSITGGRINNNLELGAIGNHSQVVLSGGTLGGEIRLKSEHGTLTVVGTDFAVNGQPVDYGELTSSCCEKA
jgi:hypothetical protein